MKISDVKEDRFREFLEEGEFGKLFIGNPDNLGDVYGFIKMNMGMDVTMVMGHRVYLHRIEDMTQEEIDSAVRDAATKNQSNGLDRLEPLLYIDERDKNIYAAGIPFSFAKQYDLYDDKTFMNWRENRIADMKASIGNVLANELIDAVRSRSLEAAELDEDSYLSEREHVRREYIGGKDLDLAVRCAEYAHDAAEDIDFSDVGAYGLMRDQRALEESRTKGILEHKNFSGRPWIDTCSERIRVEDAIMRDLHDSPDPALVTRRNMYRTLDERFEDDKPSKVKLVFSTRTGDEPFTIEYRRLMSDILNGRNLSKFDFTSSERERMQTELTLDKYGDPNVLDVKTVLYRGKPVYENHNEVTTRSVPTLSEIAQEAKEAAASKDRPMTSKERDGR